MLITWQAGGVLIALAAFVLAIVDHKINTVKAMTTLTYKLDAVIEAVNKVDKELEKRDAQIAAAWNKIDRIHTRLTIVESRCKVEHEHEEDKYKEK